MSGGVQGAGHGNQQNILYANPPCAGDGPDLYIRKLLAPVTEGPPPEGDKLSLGGEEHGLGSHETGHKLSKIVKWAGIIFAAVLAFIGIKKFLSLGTVAKTAVKTAEKAVGK